MIYTYKHRVIDDAGQLKTRSEKIDAAEWLAYLQANEARYGNLHEFVTSALPSLRQENPLVAASLAEQIDQLFHDQEPTAVFQFLMHCWHAFKANEIPPGAWAAALACAWQCGQRAMLDHVLLSEALVIRMFEAADPEALFRVGASRKEWASYVAALPDTLDIYRGISSGTRHQENGLSWTLNAEEAKKFSARNVISATQIPGVIHARVPKSALLASFDLDEEVVIDPRVPKQDVSTNFLSGPGLTKFRQNWKKWQAEEAKRLAWQHSELE